MVTKNEKEFFVNCIKKQKDCEFSLKYLLEKETHTSEYRNYFTMLRLVKKGEETERMYDYGHSVFGEKLLKIRNVLDVISGIFPTESEKGSLVIPGYGKFEISSKNESEIVSSKHRYGIIKSDWPIAFCGFNVTNTQASTDWNRKLLAAKIPYYPNIAEAIIDLFDLPIEHFSRYGAVYVVVPDYRARIDSLKLLFSEAELKITSPEMKLDDLLIKVFAKTSKKTVTMLDLHPTSQTLKWPIGFHPDTLSVVLFSTKDNMSIDWRELTKWSVEEEGIVIERPTEEILSLAQAGESQNLEYKYDVTDPNSKNDFIESVVAFLNSNRGLILVGVDDNGNIVGCKQSKDAIQKIIHDCCDPPPRDVKVEQKEIDGNTILIVDVPEGDNKPHQSRRDKNFYIRHNATDMKIERSELLQILGEQQEKSEYPGI